MAVGLKLQQAIWLQTIVPSSLILAGFLDILNINFSSCPLLIWGTFKQFYTTRIDTQLLNFKLILNTGSKFKESVLLRIDSENSLISSVFL